MSGPAKVNALQGLRDAAKAIGWSVIDDTEGVALQAPTGEAVFIDHYNGRDYLNSGGVNVPVELIPLLRGASR